VGRRVYEALNRQSAEGSPPSELIIYWWTAVANPITREMVLDTFFTSVMANSNDPRPERASVEERIQVVVYTDESPPVFLATP
jgi:hypothetical protein